MYNLRTKIPDFGGFDSSRALMSRVGIPRPIGNFPESLSQLILAGMILVGRLCAYCMDPDRVMVELGCRVALPTDTYLSLSLYIYI